MKDFISHQAEKILACYTDSSLNSCINKAEENDIEKAEGSKGGKIIGHTKSGKAIYATQNARREKSFTSADHRDAAYVHLDLSSKKNKEGYQNAGEHHSSEYERHMNTSQYKKKNEDLDGKVEKSKSDDKFAKVMGEFKAGTLKSSDGSPVTKRSQAIVIAMSESGKDVEKAEEDELEKGVIDDLSYQSKDSGFITTTGKEMKSKLETVKTKNLTELSNIAVKQAALVTQIGSQPDRDDNSYQLEKYHGLIPTPKTYSYECCNKIVESAPYLYEAPKTEAPEVNINDLKSQYRDLVYKGINLQVENLQIDTFIRNTKDTKEISLNLQIATALGF